MILDLKLYKRKKAHPEQNPGTPSKINQINDNSENELLSLYFSAGASITFKYRPIQ